jgi:hypothetical protein
MVSANKTSNYFQAAEAVFKGIDDMEVQLVHKLSLASRASMLQKSKLVSTLDHSMREKLIICSQGQDLIAAVEISLEGKVKSRYKLTNFRRVDIKLVSQGARCSRPKVELYYRGRWP